MQKVDQVYLPPGVCFICETTPQEGTAVVDTERNFNATALTHLDGRKYLCGACIAAAGAEIGLASDFALKTAEFERDTALGRLSALRDYIRSLADGMTGPSLEAVESAAPAVVTAVKPTKAKAASGSA